MKLFLPSKKTDAIRREIVPIRLRALRLAKLFENVGVLLGLIDDGVEKSSGEYILDGHYVTSLVERALERLHMIVHDALVLAPQYGEELYSQLGRCSRPAHEEFIDIDAGHAARSAMDQTLAGPVEPEYALLQRALAWMGGPRGEREGPVRNLLHAVLGRVFEEELRSAGAGDPPVVEVHAGAGHVVHVVDLDAPQAPPPGAVAAADELSSRPFARMVRGADAGARSRNPGAGAPVTWFATVGSDNVSMVRATPDGGVLLAVRQSYDPESDFAFLLCSGEMCEKSTVPAGRAGSAGSAGSAGFETAPTGFGSMTRVSGVSNDAFDEHLSEIGRLLFSVG